MPLRAHCGNTNVSLATDVQALPFKGQHLLGTWQTAHYAGPRATSIARDLTGIMGYLQLRCLFEPFLAHGMCFQVVRPSRWARPRRVGTASYLQLKHPTTASRREHSDGSRSQAVRRDIWLDGRHGLCTLPPQLSGQAEPHG